MFKDDEQRSDWKTVLSNYSKAEQERLEAAAEAQDARIRAAASDPTHSLVQDGVDISELWFAVLRRREELTQEQEQREKDATERETPKRESPSEAQEAPLVASEPSADPQPPESALEDPEAPEPASKPAAKKSAAKTSPAKKGPGRPRKDVSQEEE